TFFQIREDRFAQCAVKILVHFRALQKIASIDSCMKICRGKKSVMFAINFASPWRSRRAGDGIKNVSCFPQGLNDSGLSCPRWSGNEKENAVPIKFHQLCHSERSEESQITSLSAFTKPIVRDVSLRST